MLMTSTLELRTPNGSGGSTNLGNVSALGAPIAVETFRAAVTPAAGTSVRLFYISDHINNPEIVYGAWTNGQDTDTEYRYLRGSGGTYGNYGSPSVVSHSGPSFGETPDKHYVAGINFPTLTPGGVVYYGAKRGSEWVLCRGNSSDNGVTWTETVLATSDKPLVRPMCPDPRDINRLNRPTQVEVVASRLDFYTEFAGAGSNFLSDLVAVPRAT
jgi:hypothetical protein